jgi:integrase
MEESMARPRKTGGSLYRRGDSAFWWVIYRNRQGQLVKESTALTDRAEAEAFLRKRLDARDEGLLPAILSGRNLVFNDWAEWFLQNRSNPPFRTHKTHLQNLRVVGHLRPVFGLVRLLDITPEGVESYLRQRLSSQREYHTTLGVRQCGMLSPATVHQEFRVLKRILNVAIKQKRMSHNPCSAVEFPVSVSKMASKPHYMTASEQARIEICAPDHLRRIVAILVETGLRPYKELMPMRMSQVDLENSVVQIADSKTPSGIGEMPLTELALQAFREQIEATPGSEYLFPTPIAGSAKPYITSLKTTWARTLKRARVPYFPLYHLRHTFASRLSAGGVSDHFVTLMLRQGDAQVFKRYSQAKLNMMREALCKMDRQANEHQKSFVTDKPN